MGSSEAETSSKSPKKSTAQEEQVAVTSSVQAPATPSYPDWSNFQAYSPVPPHGYFPSSSPQTHPYMFQPMMPPYMMYPPGGIYSHPSIPPGSHPYNPYAMPSQNGTTNEPPKETEAKSSEGKEKSPMKRSKDSLGSLNMISAKLSGTTNGALSQSGESDSDSSTEGSDANSQNDSQTEPFGENGKQPMREGQVANGPTTNLNIGMDYWPVSSTNNNSNGKVTANNNNNSLVPAEHWVQNERELKKLKRKQSNRESARRSRLRKQAECEELAIRAEALKQENSALRAEVERIRKEYQELSSHNESLKKKIGEADKKDEKDNEKKA